MNTTNQNKQFVVKEEHLARVMKSGSLDVLATPALIAWMEETACACLELESDLTSVGISMNMTHDAASALDATIDVHCVVEAIQGRKISFSIEAYDGKTCIGKAHHERFIVNSETFLQKVYEK